MKTWLMGNRFENGQLILNAPVACEIDTSESLLYDLGRDIRGYVLVAPPPFNAITVIVDSRTGAIIGTDLTAVKHRIAQVSSSPVEAMLEAQDIQRATRDEAFVCTEDQFWSFIAKLQELDQL